MSTDFDAAEFDDSNPEPRCPCVLLLNTSYSMFGKPIEALNEGLVAFRDDLDRDELARLRVEVAIVTFGGRVDLAQIGPRQPLALNGLAFREMFQWLSTSMRTVSHAEVDAEVPLQTPIGWAKA